MGLGGLIGTQQDLGGCQYQVDGGHDLPLCEMSEMSDLKRAWQAGLRGRGRRLGRASMRETAVFWGIPELVHRTGIGGRGCREGWDGEEASNEQ